MTKKLLSLIFLSFSSVLSYAQFSYYQYFDGANTNPNSSVIIIPDTSSGNIWQVGSPQKAKFNSAATVPNVLITDTVNNYPTSNVSSFHFYPRPTSTGGILAIRWKQKLDMEADRDGGIVEFSLDTGQTWQNAFNNPMVYNFYGYNNINKDTLLTGEYAFSGTDTNWRDIWLCFDKSFLSLTDSFAVRFTFQSDTAGNDKEGWMIDNMMIHNTWIHTVESSPGKAYFNVYPTKTTGIVHIETAKLQEYHIIESIKVIDVNGRVVQEHGKAPTKFYIDIGHHPEGLYYLKIKTNKKEETFPVFVNKI